MTLKVAYGGETIEMVQYYSNLSIEDYQEMSWDFSAWNSEKSHLRHYSNGANDGVMSILKLVNKKNSLKFDYCYLLCAAKKLIQKQMLIIMHVFHMQFFCFYPNE